jgi:hypothetical protein
MAYSAETIKTRLQQGRGDPARIFSKITSGTRYTYNSLAQQGNTDGRFAVEMREKAGPFWPCRLPVMP